MQFFCGAHSRMSYGRKVDIKVMNAGSTALTQVKAGLTRSVRVQEDSIVVVFRLLAIILVT